VAQPLATALDDEEKRKAETASLSHCAKIKTGHQNRRFPCKAALVFPNEMTLRLARISP
jgi:hypothetical protein